MKRGFSLVELLVVMIVAGVLLMISINIASSVITRSRFAGAVNKIVADIAYAKELASKENRWVKIDFQSDGRTYTIEKQKVIGDLTQFELVKRRQPLEGRMFFTPGGTDVIDFAVNSRGEVKKVADLTNPTSQPSEIILTVWSRSGDGSLSNPIIYQRRIRIYPYGGIKVEK